MLHCCCLFHNCAYNHMLDACFVYSCIMCFFMLTFVSVLLDVSCILFIDIVTVFTYLGNCYTCMIVFTCVPVTSRTLSLEHLCSTCCCHTPHDAGAFMHHCNLCTTPQTDTGPVIRFALMHLCCSITLQLRGFPLGFVLCLKPLCPALQACNSNRRTEQSSRPRVLVCLVPEEG